MGLVSGFQNSLNLWCLWWLETYLICSPQIKDTGEYFWYLFILMYLSVCMYAHYKHAEARWHQKKAVISYHCGCWESNLGFLQEQQVLSTAEPSLQHPPPLKDVLSESFSYELYCAVIYGHTNRGED